MRLVDCNYAEDGKRNAEWGWDGLDSTVRAPYPMAADRYRFGSDEDPHREILLQPFERSSTRTKRNEEFVMMATREVN